MAEDAELVRRARGGDQDAFADLVTRHADAARRAAVRAGAGADAEDMVQDAFVKAHQRLADYRGEASFRSWLVAIVANEARNLHRSRRRHEEAVTLAARLEPAAEPVDSAVDGALALQWRRELVAAVRTLTAGEREVIASRFLLDRSEAETAAQLDLPLGTVKSTDVAGTGPTAGAPGGGDRGHRGGGGGSRAPAGPRGGGPALVDSVLRFAGVQINLDGSDARHRAPAPASRCRRPGLVSLAQAPGSRPSRSACRLSSASPSRSRSPIRRRTVVPGW